MTNDHSLTDPYTSEMRVLLVAETDAYLRYACSLQVSLAEAGIGARVMLVDGTLLPTPEQISNATNGGGPVEIVTASTAIDFACDGAHDWTFLLATGPVVAYLSAAIRRRGTATLLASAVPGIALPERARAMRARQFTDLFIVHSHLEALVFSRLLQRMELDTRVALTSLPLIRDITSIPLHPSVDCLFAAQPSVPALFVERVQLLTTLATTYGRIGVKLRTVRGEGPQTHFERYPYESIAVALEKRLAGRFIPIEGPMTKALELSETFATVSSTAALEAIAGGRKVRVINDFGISQSLINYVFRGSGLLGPAAEPPVRDPEPAWMHMNYFHDPGENDLVAALTAMEPRQWSLRPAASRSFTKALTQGYRKVTGFPGLRNR